VRADERVPTPLRIDDEGTTVRFEAEPHGLVTILLA
jgi:hypothetical protein